MMVATEGMLAQVERILRSETFHNAGALRRLLTFLAEKSAAGQAEQLKEYSVAVDGLGRSPNYDPRHDSAVRLQVSRLRQKLADYYRAEGKGDRFIIDLPKGRFKLVVELREQAAAHPLEAVEATSAPPLIPTVYPRSRTDSWRRVSVFLASGLAVALVWATVATFRLASRSHQPENQAQADWAAPELQQLWRSFLVSERPLIISIADPLFVQFKGYGVYRELSINDWEEVTKSRSIATLRSSLGNPELDRVSRYATFGEVNSSFILGKLLAPHFRHISLSRSSEISWEQLADNNVLFVGAERIISQHLRALPVDLELVGEFGGVAVLHPRPGEPRFLANQVEYGTTDEGEAYAVISHVPGPGGQGDIETFTSDTTPGRLAAVQWFTTSLGAKAILSKLRESSGEIPRYFQVALNVKFKDGVPTETSYVLHRALRLKNPALGK